MVDLYRKDHIDMSETGDTQDFLTPLQVLLWKRQQDLINARVLHFLLWTMNEDKSQTLETGDPRPKVDRCGDSEERENPKKHLRVDESTEQEEDTKLFDEERIGRILPVHEINQQELEGPKEPGGYVRRPGFRSKSGIGPPPRPFKKARYAWEIKNYEHTVNNMTQNLGECSTDLQDESQDSQSSDVNSEGSHEDGVLDHREGMLPGSALDRAAFIEARARGRPDLMPPIMPAPYPTTYGMMTAPPPPPHVSLQPEDCLKDGQRVSPDPDAGILRWHTRQLCRSIFDNTVNRMLENMGFSPVTERSQGIHPLLVLSLSDDEEREENDAQQRALENEALTAAMHHKGLFIPAYHYDALESGGTTTDYDSSDDDSDLGEDSVPDELSHEATMHMAHMVSRPLPRVPVVPTMPTPAQPPPSPPPSESPIASSPCDSQRPFSPEPIPSLQPPEEPDCDDEDEACDGVVDEYRKDSNVDCDEEEESVVEANNNKNCVVEDQKSVMTDETKNKGGAHKPLETPDKTENENNNDKFFVDQAIEMAIKQQGLGYQQA